MTDLHTLWGATLQEIAGRAAHEVKDALNGVALNLEVLRSRLGSGKDPASLAGFATAAAEQFEVLTARTEALLFLARTQKSGAPADVAVTLKHLAVLLVPAAKADGTLLTVGGYDVSVATTASAPAVRLALASGLLSLIKEGGAGGTVMLEKGPDTVVRFSHESADVGDLDPATAAALLAHGISARPSGRTLQIRFP